MTLYDDIRHLWRQYANFYVVGNNHLKKLTFHTLMGIMLTYRNCSYTENATPITTRYHLFIIQPSGTGKSQILKYLYELVKSLGIPCVKTLKDNEASITGSIERVKATGKIEKTEGILSWAFLLVYDEGSVLLGKPSRHTENLTDNMQTAMDDPGFVSKGMKLGRVSYETKTTICTGSYMFKQFEHTLWTKGLLQRMGNSYKEFNEEEKRNMRIGVNLMKNNQNKERIIELKKAFSVIMEQLPKDREVVFDKNAVNKFNLKMEEVYNAYFHKTFEGPKQEIMDTFFNRLHLLIDKVAAQKCLVEGRSVVSYDDLIHGLRENEWHIQSLHNVFKKITIKNIVGEETRRENMVWQLIKPHTSGINQSALLLELDKFKISGRWDLGVNKTLELLKEMSESGEKIVVAKGANNSRLYYAK